MCAFCNKAHWSDQCQISKTVEGTEGRVNVTIASAQNIFVTNVIVSGKEPPFGPMSRKIQGN